MDKFKKILILIIFATFSLNAFASSAKIELEKANTDINDLNSLQNGVKLFMNYCSGCHSISFIRYNRIASDLNIDEKIVKENLMFNSEKIGDNIIANMPKEYAVNLFGTLPPDLSLVSRYKGNDWIYTYLNSFYADNSKNFGVNNHILKGLSMPDVLWNLKQNKSQDDFEQSIRDITNFLDYVGEPIKKVRIETGIKVISFLFIFLILAYLMKKEYWKDVKHGIWRKRN